MKECYAFVNGKDLFIDDKIVVNTIAKGVEKGYIKAACKCCAGLSVITGLALLGCGVYSEIVRRKNETEQETVGVETDRKNDIQG